MQSFDWTCLVVVVIATSTLTPTTTAQCLTSSSPSSTNTIATESRVGDAVRSLIDGSIKFSLDMMKTLEYQNRMNKDSVGIFFSPYSVWSALMMTFLGATGRTENELRNVLGTRNWNKDTAWEAFRNMRIWNSIRQQQQQSYTVANRVYFQDGTAVRPCIADMMNSEIGFLNFASDPDGSARAINDFINKQTDGKIKDLIPTGSLSRITKMIIANAVYFKESWRTRFDPAKTKRGTFTLSYRKKIQVNMMNLKGMFPYGISEELQCTGLELSYEGKDLSMLILLPNDRYRGVSTLVNRLTPDLMDDLLADMYPREVSVSLPKFSVEDNFELSSALVKMGVRTLFDTRQSNLSDFVSRAGDISVDSVLHKSFINVDEEGTEAAAATAVLGFRMARPIGPVAFVADHPFLFMIRDNVASLVLFMGAIQRPPKPSSS